MSRAYEIQWVSVADRVTRSDKIELKVSLLGVLPAGEMIDLLRGELLRDGWKAREDGALVRTEGEVAVELSPDGQTVTLSLEQDRQVAARGITKQAASDALEKQKTQTEQELAAQQARTLGRAEPEVRAGLDAAVQRVYVEALRKKAATLGRVESVQETRGEDGQYEVTIRVKT